MTALLCDGLVCDGFIYKYLWADLGRHLSVAHFNYRGHGRSAAPADPNRIEVPDHAADVSSVRHHLGDPPVVLVGHSFGTQVALEAYRAQPERIQAMVFLCGSFGNVTHTFKGTDVLAEALPSLLSAANRFPRLSRAVWSRFPPDLGVRVAQLVGDVAQGAKPEDIAPYFKHVSQVDLPEFLRFLKAAGDHSAEDLLPEIRVPVLVIAGELDSFTPPSTSRALAEGIPGAKFVLVPGATHVAPLEQPELVWNEIWNFLSREAIL